MDASPIAGRWIYALVVVGSVIALLNLALALCRSAFDRTLRGSFDVGVGVAFALVVGLIPFCIVVSTFPARRTLPFPCFLLPFGVLGLTTFLSAVALFGLEIPNKVRLRADADEMARQAEPVLEHARSDGKRSTPRDTPLFVKQLGSFVVYRTAIIHCSDNRAADDLGVEFNLEPAGQFGEYRGTALLYCPHSDASAATDTSHDVDHLEGPWYLVYEAP